LRVPDKTSDLLAFPQRNINMWCIDVATPGWRRASANAQKIYGHPPFCNLILYDGVACSNLSGVG
jgi:hypothetical protein